MINWLFEMALTYPKTLTGLVVGFATLFFFLAEIESMQKDIFKD